MGLWKNIWELRFHWNKLIHGRGGGVLGGGLGGENKKQHFFIGGWVEPQGGTIESLWGGNPAPPQGVFILF
jgi:hypothetical protein